MPEVAWHPIEHTVSWQDNGWLGTAILINLCYYQAQLLRHYLEHKTAYFDIYRSGREVNLRGGVAEPRGEVINRDSLLDPRFSFLLNVITCDLIHWDSFKMI
jgi:hypothetical protein